MRKKRKKDFRTSFHTVCSYILGKHMKFIDKQIAGTTITRSAWIREAIEKEIKRIKKEERLQNKVHKILQKKYDKREALFESLFE